MDIKFNINDYVKIKLTDDIREVFKKNYPMFVVLRHVDYWLAPSYEEYEKRQTDIEGYFVESATMIKQLCGDIVCNLAPIAYTVVFD